MYATTPELPVLVQIEPASGAEASPEAGSTDLRALKSHVAPI
jgi:hypothetical protein